MRISPVLALLLLPVGCTLSCSEPRAPTAALDSAMDPPSVRWVSPAEMGPTANGAGGASARGAHHRLLATHEDGSKEYALVLAQGDEVATGLADFARSENVVAAHFTAIGAVRDAEVAWFDPSKKQYKGMKRGEQLEVLTLAGDIGVAQDGKPAVHVHVVLGRNDGTTFGGHLIGATTSPTLEVFVTTFPHPLTKKKNPELDLQLFDLTAPEK